MSKGTVRNQHAIVDALREHGPMTAREAAVAAGVMWSTTEGALRHLARMGAVENSGEKRDGLVVYRVAGAP